MQVLPLLLVLLFASPASAGEYENDIAIALALAASQDATLNSEANDVAQPLVYDPEIIRQHSEGIERLDKLMQRMDETFTTRQELRTKEVLVPKYCRGKQCGWKKVRQNYMVEIRVPVEPAQSTDDYATPPDAVGLGLALLNPNPGKTLIDPGSGDGRVAITAARRYGCRAIGIEIDPERITLARANAERAGVSHLVTFIQGDFTKMNWPKADNAYVYQFEEDLALIRDKLAAIPRVVSYSHKVPGLEMKSYGGKQFYLWEAPQVVRAVKSVPSVKYGNRYYTHPPCNNPRCAMCNAIRRGLAAQGAY
jgi:hypothetical protein